MRIGHSIDIHPFDNARRLVLGGVPIDHIGLKGHSDADVIFHVVAESILGALALGDLGTHFPDSDDQYRNKPSHFFVTKAVEFMKQHEYKIGNIDCMILLQTPKLSPYKEQIQKNIAELLECDPHQVSIKATTAEGMGFIGRAEGVLASATVLLVTE